MTQREFFAKLRQFSDWRFDGRCIRRGPKTTRTLLVAARLEDEEKR